MKQIFLIIFLFVFFGNLLGQQVNEAVDSVKVIATDTTIYEKAKAKAYEILKDSINTTVVLPDTADILEQGKTKAKQVLQDPLGNKLPVEISPIDSSLVNTAKEKVKNRDERHLSGETGVRLPRKVDSASVKQETKRLANEKLEEETDIDIPNVQADSTTVNTIKEKAIKRAGQELKESEYKKDVDTQNARLAQVEETTREIEKTRQQMQQQEYRKQLKQKMASQAKSYITEHADKIQQVQSKMGELKKKYSYVPNSNDLGTAKKRTSLENESVWKRLVLGGNFNISETNPLNVDLAPVVGWKFNTLFEMGITGAYRARIGANDKGINRYGSEEVYGYSLFVSHLVFKNFFGYMEGENISKVTGTAENHGREWQQTLLIGIGRKFNIAKFLEMQAIITYNFLHDNTDYVYNNPVVFKTGFRVRK